jgi:PhnB protein
MKPEGWRSVTARIFVDEPQELVDFVKSVFGATGDYRSDRPTVMTIGDSMLMISDTAARARTNAFLYVYVGDVDEVYRRALRAGATSLEQPSKTPYGDRRAMVEDSWGAQQATNG